MDFDDFWIDLARNNNCVKMRAKPRYMYRRLSVMAHGWGVRNCSKSDDVGS